MLGKPICFTARIQKRRSYLHKVAQIVWPGAAEGFSSAGAVATAAELLFNVVGEAREREQPLGQLLGRNPVERDVLREKERIAEKSEVALVATRSSPILTSTSAVSARAATACSYCVVMSFVA